MPISETSAGVSSMDSVASLGSSGSVASSNSFESLDFLTPEERECLTFLEETIEALDEDSSEWAPEERVAERVYPESKKELVKPPQIVPGRLDSRSADQNGNTQKLNLPRVALPHDYAHNNHKVDPTSQNAGRTQCGSNTLPKYTSKPIENTNTVAPNRRSEPPRGVIIPGDSRLMSQVIFQSQSEKPREGLAKQGPPTAPKPRFPSNINFKSSSIQPGGPPNAGQRPSSRSSVKISPRVPPAGVEHGSTDHGPASKFSPEQRRQPPGDEASHQPGPLPGPIGQRLKAGGHGGQASTEGPPVNPRVPPTRSPELPSSQRFSVPRPTVIVDAGPALPVGNGSSLVTAGSERDANPPYQWRLGATKSSSLQRVGAGHNTQPNAGSASNTSAAASSLQPPAPWQLGPNKSSSLQRVSTASYSQPSASSGPAAVIRAPGSLRDIPASGTSGNPPQWQLGPPQPSVARSSSPNTCKHLRARPMSVCSETDLSRRHGAQLEPPSAQPDRRSFPMKISHMSSKFQKPKPKALNLQNTHPGSTRKDHSEALRKLGLLKE